MKCHIGRRPEQVRYTGFSHPDPVPALPRLHNIIRETRRGPGFGFVTNDEQHRSQRLVVQVTLSGRCRCRRDHQVWNAQPGAAIVWRQPDEALEVRYPEEEVTPLDILIVGIEAGVAEPLATTLLESGPVAKLPLTSGILRELQALLPQQGWQHQRLSPRREADMIWDLLTTMVVAGHQPQQHRHPQLEQAMDIMLANLPTTTVATVAKSLNMSRVHLDRIFQKDLEIAPGKWLRQQRLGASRTLLRDSSLSLDDIALQCGFGSSTSFIAAFKQQYGLTPGQWRQEFGR